MAPPAWPEDAEKGQKWIEISIGSQTLVLWEGKRPVYATLISSGQAGIDDPKTTSATVRGTFKIRNKHITATMDSNESSAVGGRAATSSGSSGGGRSGAGEPGAPNKPKAGGAKAGPSSGAKVPRRGDGEYGVTKRRGEGTFQLRDVPYIQYFENGYALHTAYWHDVFGTPRSHGCVNLSPVDAHRVFLWTDPPIPEGWHAVNAGEEMGEGTTVIVHE
jgi:lipoprotein-anchoring transpeptidase ErfK/SrfK